MDSELGYIQDLEENKDLNRTVTFTNDKYKYKLNVPEFWSSNDYRGSGYGSKDLEEVEYEFTGGHFTVNANTKMSLEDAVKAEDTAQKKNGDNDAEYKYTATDETIFNVNAKKYVVDYARKKVKYQETTYIFNKNNITYTVTLHLKEAVHTADNEARLKKVFESMTFTN
ncbi:hypothetical protein D3C73_1199830 [compost metagenome]